MKRKYRRYTDTEFVEAVKTSGSYRQVLAKIGLAVQGGNYVTVKSKIKKLGLDTSHFHGQGWVKVGFSPTQKKISVYLVKGSSISAYKLKNRLLKEGLKDYRCEVCGITEWNGKKAPLELDHMNGDSTDNRLKNLRVVCPNCHAQTDTYCGKNMRVGRRVK